MTRRVYMKKVIEVSEIMIDPDTGHEMSVEDCDKWMEDQLERTMQEVGGYVTVRTELVFEE